MFKEKKILPDNFVGNNRVLIDTKIKGDIFSTSDFRIDGEIEGNITTSGRVVVGKSGKIHGTIQCDNADVEGEIIGNLLVTNLLSVKLSANIQGEVKIGKLAIEPGATFNVKCQMEVLE